MSYDTLKIRRAEALASINRQIQKGDELFTKGHSLIKEKGRHNIPSRDRDLFQSSFTQWVDLTYATLIRVFDSSKYALEFKEKHSSEVQYVGSSWVPDIQYYLSKQLIQKLDYLKMLRDSMDDFTEKETQPDLARRRPNANNTLEKLEKLKAIIDNAKGFRSKKDFLDWGSKVEPLLAFNPEYKRQFATDLNMIHANLSAQTAKPLANRMRTTLNKAIEQIRHEIDTLCQPEAIKLITTQKDYIHQDRIKELKEISSAQFDLCKLLKFCEELNICYKANNLFAIIMLTRALIDHVPPIFGFKTFNELVNNYSGTKSFKENMERLNASCRKIADQHLHTPIRKSESLPTMNQVDFSNDIDVLLAEIHRILKP
jgi:hypothetical protein